MKTLKTPNWLKSVLVQMKKPVMPKQVKNLAKRVLGPRILRLRMVIIVQLAKSWLPKKQKAASAWLKNPRPPRWWRSLRLGLIKSRKSRIAKRKRFYRRTRIRVLAFKRAWRRSIQRNRVKLAETKKSRIAKRKRFYRRTRIRVLAFKRALKFKIGTPRAQSEILKLRNAIPYVACIALILVLLSDNISFVSKTTETSIPVEQQGKALAKIELFHGKGDEPRTYLIPGNNQQSSWCLFCDPPVHKVVLSREYPNGFRFKNSTMTDGKIWVQFQKPGAKPDEFLGRIMTKGQGAPAKVKGVRVLYITNLHKEDASLIVDDL